MNQRIVTIVGDSLALPRPEDRLFEGDVYPAQLQRRLGPEFYVVNRSSVGNYAGRLISEETTVYAIQGSQAECYVIQIGIVDCAPRLFSEEEKKLLATLIYSGLFRGLARAWIDYRSRQRYARTKEKPIFQTRPEDFELYYRTLIKNIRTLTPARAVIAINIAAPGESMTSRTYGVRESIDRFNQIIARIAADNSGYVRLLDLFSATRDDPALVLPDGHHLAAAAQDLIAGRLADLILDTSRNR